MTTPAQRAKLRREYFDAQARSERAANLGDHAGSIIAASMARRVLARMVALVESDVMARAAQ